MTNTSTTQPQLQADALRVTMMLSSGSWQLSELGEIGPTSAGDSAKTAWAASNVAAAVLAGRRCASTISTLDARGIDTELANMLQCTIGDLRKSLQAGQDEPRQAATKSSQTSTVVASGLSAASPDKVNLLVAITLKSTPHGGSPTNRLERLVMTLQQDGGQWLVSQVEQAPVQ